MEGRAQDHLKIKDLEGGFFLIFSSGMLACKNTREKFATLQPSHRKTAHVFFTYAKVLMQVFHTRARACACVCVCHTISLNTFRCLEQGLEREDQWTACSNAFFLG